MRHIVFCRRVRRDLTPQGLVKDPVEPASSCEQRSTTSAWFWLEAAIANAKLLSDKPATHARAQVLTATFLKCLGIIPSSGTSWTTATRLLEMPYETFRTRPHHAAVQPVVKRERKGSFRVRQFHHENDGVRPTNLFYCFSGVAGFADAVAAASAGEDFAVVIASTATRNAQRLYLNRCSLCVHRSKQCHGETPDGLPQ